MDGFVLPGLLTKLAGDLLKILPGALLLSFLAS
jgi:hypothetical protein